MSLSNSDLEVLLCSPCRLRALTDAELMDALRSGCNDALATLFERHSSLVFQIARGRLCSDGEAEAAVRRIFGSVFQAKDEFNSAATASQLGCSNRRSPVRRDPLHERSMH